MCEALSEFGTVTVGKGEKNSFQVIVDGEVVWDGLSKGPPRTAKWDREAILAAVRAAVADKE